MLTALLHAQHNTVALAEPMQVAHLATDPARLVAETTRFLHETRVDILRMGQGPSITQKELGEQTTNFFGDHAPGGTLRESLSKRRSLAIRKPLTPDFRLFIKHPALFTAHWRDLSARYSLFANIRSPLAVLASWQTVALPVNKGQLPVGERNDQVLQARLAQTQITLDRQIVILEWFLRIYAQFPRQNVLRYEDIVQDQTTLLRTWFENADWVHMPLTHHPISKRYPDIDLDALRFALRPLQPLITFFYPEGMPE
ncbi:hypothetical protein [uncultured Tateyamaria sp.]|uniref:hypothetical protein n=1 Tax=uncultured Tateyamaria sp. TaxID=455651 RepID=UPI00260C8899|nr:hypothetical protein [uncultured Tateyamaria sp.]